MTSSLPARPQATFPISDHYFTQCPIAFPRPPRSAKEVSFRKLKKIDIAAFSSDISTSALYTNDVWNNINTFSDCYNSTLADILNKHAPLKSKTVIDRPKVPWFNDEIKKLKCKRRRLEKKAITTNLPSDWNNYHKVRNQHSANLKSARVNYYSNLIGQCAGDSRKLFRVVNSLSKEPLGTCLPEHDNATKLANEFASFFVTKIELIKEDLNKIHVREPRLLVVNAVEKLHHFSAVSVEDVSKIIRESTSVSCKLDPVPTWLLKSCLDALAPSITEIVNMSVLTGLVPDNWKTALVVPLLKKPGLDLVLKNFHPVSNLPFISKVAEKAVLQQLLHHCENHAPLPKFQSGFRKFHSTETALLKVQNDILLRMDNKEVTLLVLLDLSAAFDTSKLQSRRTWRRISIFV